MSCYICDDRHITVLAAYAAEHAKITRADFWATLSADDRERFDDETDIEVLATLLHRENVASFRARYQGRHESDIGPYAYDRDAVTAVRVGAFSAVQIIKAAHCFDYQACEHDGWGDSFACKVIKAIIDHATHKLPGYNEAVWGIPDATETKRAG